MDRDQIQSTFDRQARAAYFRGIAERLRPGALLACSDLDSDLHAPGQRPLLDAWFATRRQP
jgi:tRNA (cmo5U34)-methyltransferase